MADSSSHRPARVTAAIGDELAELSFRMKRLQRPISD
jgi:hypothetical protein